MLATPLALSDATFQSDDFSSESALAVPLFQEDHSRELIDGGVAAADPKEMARFVFKRTQDLLPVPFKGRAHRVAQALIESANTHQMDPVFLMAVIAQESKFNPDARGSHGEIGLMQLKPSTAASVSGGATEDDVIAQLEDPAQNVRLGAAYLAKLRHSFRRRSSLYISAYNMGAARVREHVAAGVEPNIYSSQVMAHYLELSSGIAQTVASTRTELPVFKQTLVL